MSDEVVMQLAKKFIARSDVKALQHYDRDQKVIYSPTETGFEFEDLEAHLAGTKTYGHYLLNQDDTCKLITFDVDLKDHGLLPAGYDENGIPTGFEDTEQTRPMNKKALIDEWHDRESPHRNWHKFLMCQFARELSEAIGTVLQLQTATAYSGNKGFHVYGFMSEPTPAADVRMGAGMAIEALNFFVPLKGNISVHFSYDDYLDAGNPPSLLAQAFENFSVEIFPKQDSLEGKGFGNLVRLPLGTNLKNPDDPTFFFDVLRIPIEMGNCFTPVDPEWALSYLEA